MDILNFFTQGVLFHRKKKPPVIMRCTHCYYELEYSAKEVRLLVRHNSFDPVCTAKEPCHICHIGFMIPVKYTDMFGKQYLFHETKPKIKNLDPNTVIQRIFEDADPENVWFFSPEDLENMPDDLDD